MLMQEGQTPSDVYAIAFGWVARTKILPNGERQILAFLLPGDIAGSDDMRDAPASFSLQTLTYVGLCTFPRRDFFTRMLEHPKVQHTIFETYVERLAVAEKLMTFLGRRSAPERIAGLVLYLHDQLERRHLIKGPVFDLPLRLEDFADAAGLTPVHVSRTLTALREQGLLEFHGGRTEILNRKGLEALVGFS
jgi:CRP-like cAMP-binding protein